MCLRTIALAWVACLLCCTKWRLAFKGDWKERSDDVVTTSVDSRPYYRVNNLLANLYIVLYLQF
jgi:hypothetical protein